jgi:hypothetical protein
MRRLLALLALLLVPVPVFAQAVGITRPIGRSAAAASLSIVLSTEDKAVLDNIDTDLTTIIGHLDGVEGFLSTIAGDTTDIETAIELLDNVLIVDDAAFTPGTTTVSMVGFEFDDTTPDSVNEGDGGAARMSGNRNVYVQVRDGAGNERGLSINSSGEALVSCSGCSGSGASHIDDAAFSPTTDDGVVVFGLFDDVSPDSVNEGDGGAVRMSANRNLYVTLRDGAGNERGLNIDASGQLAVTVAGAALTSLQLIDDSIFVDDADFTDSTSAGQLTFAVAESVSPSTVTEGDVGALAMTLNRALKVTLYSAAGTELSPSTDATRDNAQSGTGPQLMLAFDDVTPDSVDEGDAVSWRASATGEAYTVLRDAAGNNRGANVNASNQLAIAGPVTNAGTFAVQVDGPALTALQLIDDPVFADDAAFTIGTSKVSMAGFTVDETSSDSADEGDAVAARTTADRLLYAVPAASTASAQAALECAIVSAASNNATNCKAAAGNFYGVDVVNTTTTTYYLRLYNTSSAPTCSSATGFIRSIPIPPAAASGQAGGIVRMSPLPVNYGTGLSYCLTGGASSTDNTSAATGIYGAVLYK